ncbi:hypothetical protein T639_11640 [Enterococcus faecium MRSN 11639]|nr:hypothetical protein T639_11640 [Enterococcus faecium MRSN 11639]
MYSYEDIKLMYDWGCFTNEQVMVFVPYALQTKKQIKSLIKKSAS